MPEHEASPGQWFLVPDTSRTPSDVGIIGPFPSPNDASDYRDVNLAELRSYRVRQARLPDRMRRTYYIEIQAVGDPTPRTITVSAQSSIEALATAARDSMLTQDE